MAGGPITSVLQFLRNFVGPVAARDTSDAQLLERFAAGGDEAAFAALVQRFGPMVLGVCRRVLADEHAVEDAFQATFLVLVRKARSVRKGQAIGSWLYGVAYRTATRARAEAARWSTRNRQVPLAAAADPVQQAVQRDLRAVLDEELNRLPAKYREPLVLCYLEGNTNEEAARILGCPCGTVYTRLARARDRLRGRLTRRGVVLSAPALATALAREATAAVPAALASSTGKAAAGGAISARAVVLAEGVSRAMTLSKLKTTLALLLAVALLAAAGVTLAYHHLAGKPRDPDSAFTNTPAPGDKGKPKDEGIPTPLGKGSFPTSSFGCQGGGFGGFGYGFGSGSGFGGGGGFGGGSSFASCKLAPLTHPAVRRELKLSTIQLKKLKKLRADQQKGMRRLFSSLRPDTFFKEPDALQKKWAELAREAEQAVAKILTAKQQKRLEEISLQQRGGFALTDPKVAEALKLTREQQQQIQTIQAGLAKEVQQLGLKQMKRFMELGKNPFDVGKAFDKMRKNQKAFQKLAKEVEKLSQAASEKLLGVLTKEQKTKWKELTGKPFHWKK
jgi:RNA polymerase sigma factor (sigma-70 family)